MRKKKQFFVFAQRSTRKGGKKVTEVRVNGTRANGVLTYACQSYTYACQFPLKRTRVRAFEREAEGQEVLLTRLVPMKE